MYELKQVGENTYYIDCPAKIGLYRLNNKEVCLIDTGNDSEAGKKILRILEENAWNLKYIINTHSNADHIGGNAYLQEKTGCKIYTSGIEQTFTNYPFLEPSFLYGGYPFKDLQNKFLLARPSKTSNINELVLPNGFRIINLPGHFFGMIGVETPDKVIFIADSLVNERIINKYHISFIYDIDAYLKTLDMLETLEAETFIPAHAEVTNNLHPLVEINRDKILEIIAKIKDICRKPKCFEDILKDVLDAYDLLIDFNQYVLVGSTIRSYLSYLYNNNEIDIIFDMNKLLWITKE